MKTKKFFLASVSSLGIATAPAGPRFVKKDQALVLDREEKDTRKTSGPDHDDVFVIGVIA